jgi:hypothetical protein
MAMPFDTLKLARCLEAAGFPAQQAGDMSEKRSRRSSPKTTSGTRSGGSKPDWTVLMWAVGMDVALTIAILGMLVRGGGHLP